MPGEQTDEQYHVAAGRVLARLNERHEQRQPCESETSAGDAASAVCDHFWTTVDTLADTANKQLDGVRSSSQQRAAVTAALDQADQCLQQLRRVIAEWAPRLPNFQVRRAQQIQQQLQHAINECQQQHLPRKKFGFSRTAGAGGGRERSSVTVSSVSATEAHSVTHTPASTTSNEFGVHDVADETVMVSCGEAAGRHVVLSRLTRCRVVVAGGSGSLHVSACVQCEIVSGAVAGAVLVQRCADCWLAAAGRQVRVHDTHRCRLLVHVASAPVIEQCDVIKFGPYPSQLVPALVTTAGDDDVDGCDVKSESVVAQQWRLAGLSALQTPLWRQVQDFNWLCPTQPSPHWACVDQDESPPSSPQSSPQSWTQLVLTAAGHMTL